MFALPALAAALLVAPPAPPPKFEIKDGDRIVWVGNTLVEREQRYGYWETALHAAFPDKQFTLRNLGWSGDTVFGDARAGFDTPAKGFERLVSLTLELKPTVIFVSYGTNESFEGEAGLPAFEKGLEKLLDALKPANARVVLFSPLPIVATAQLPDVAERNKVIVRYAGVVQTVAARWGLFFADTYKHVGGGMAWLDGGKNRLGIASMPDATLNGMHLTEAGCHHTATEFIASLGIRLPPTDRTWDSLAPLRKAIVAKNELFFYRWRPQNETYLFGFRKHEQGKNGKEIAEFDPLVAKAEEEIETLRKGLKK